MQDLVSTVLYALLRLRGEATALKLARKESIHEAFILAAYGFWQVISCVKNRTYVCSGKIVPRRQRSSSDKRWS